jgi:hypothetical protein
MKFDVEYTDTFSGEANYSWVRRATVDMPELTHYGYTGSADGSYAKANRLFERELMRRAKAAVGLTGVRGRREELGETLVLYPYGSATVLFVTYREG